MLETWLLTFCRVAPVVALHPVFGARAVPRGLTVATAAALTCALACEAPERAMAGASLLLGAREVAVGATIGLLGQAVFGAIEAAGRFVDDARGANVAHLYAPQLESVASPLGQLELSAALAIFWGLGLHGHLLRGLAASFAAVPLGGAPGPGPLALGQVLEIARTLASAALGLAGPAAACCVLVDLLMGLVNRSAPNANVFLLSQPVKLTVAVLVTALGLPAHVAAWGELWSAHDAWVPGLLGR